MRQEGAAARRAAARLSTLLFLVVGALVASTAPASAHTDLESSDPADGSVVSEPVTSVSFTFGAAVEAVDDELGIFYAAGDPIEIATVTSEESGTVIRLTPIDPLEGGVFGARWAIHGTDGHPVVGSITFTVEAGTSATTVPVPDDADATDASDVEEPSAEPTAVSDDLVAALAPPPSTTTAERLANIARFFTYLGVLIAVGTLAFIRWVHGGPPPEERRLEGLVRAGALLVLLGAATGLAPDVMIAGGGGIGALFDLGEWADMGDRGIAPASVLRLVGAVVILVGLSPDKPRDALTIGGATALLVSGIFAGHTASESPRLLVALSDVAHVAAVSVWTGGIAALAATLWIRHKRQSEMGVDVLAARFSILAAYTVGIAGLTGVLLAWAILPDLGALTSSSFGRLLVAKVAVVLVIVTIGAYNHFVVVPAIEASSADVVTTGSRASRLRMTVTTELALLVVVVAITAVLVASSAV